MAKKALKPGTLLSPVPVVMVSCGEGEAANIITIAWTGIVNSDPPMTYISVRKSRHSHELIRRSGEFVINLTTEALAFSTDYCGVKSGRDKNKFQETGLTPGKAQKVGCPLIEESPVNLECKVREVHSYPSHDMFVAEIVAMDVDEELISEKGKILLEEAGLLAFIHGEYFGVKKYSMGRLGFSVMKPKTKKRINKEKHLERIAKNREKKKKKG